MRRIVSKHALMTLVIIMSLILTSWGCTRTPPPSTPPSTPTFTPLSTVSSQSGILTAISGRVMVLLAGSTAWTEAEVGMNLKAGDYIRTKADSSALITFFEGSTMELQPNTEVDIEELSAVLETGSTTISLGQTIGTTMSRVEKLVDPVSRYEIATPSGLAVVRGTKFKTILLPDKSTLVKVTEGSVNVSAQGVEKQARAGEQIVVPYGGIPSHAIPIPEERKEVVGTRDRDRSGGREKDYGGIPLPEANFEAMPTRGSAPLTVQFTNLSKGHITARVWDFGDGASSLEKNPTHTYSVPGNYTAYLTVANRVGSDTAARSITVYPAPEATNMTEVVANVVPS